MMCKYLQLFMLKSILGKLKKMFVCLFPTQLLECRKFNFQQKKLLRLLIKKFKSQGLFSSVGRKGKKISLLESELEYILIEFTYNIIPGCPLLISPTFSPCWRCVTWVRNVGNASRLFTIGSRGRPPWDTGNGGGGTTREGQPLHVSQSIYHTARIVFKSQSINPTARVVFQGQSIGVVCKSQSIYFTARVVSKSQSIYHTARVVSKIQPYTANYKGVSKSQSINHTARVVFKSQRITIYMYN